MEMLVAASSRPLALVELAQASLAGHFLAPANESHSASVLYAELLQTVRGLGQPFGGCERIQNTPLPYAYVVHLRTFLTFVLCGVPLVHACDWQGGSIPLSILIAFGLLGIEASAVECERPFSERPTKNNHDLEKFATVISKEVTEMLERAAARESLSQRLE